MPYSAKVSRTFFSYVSHEVDRPLCLDSRFLERLRGLEHDGEAATVIADSRTLHPCSLTRHLDVGSLGKNRIEVSGNHHRRTLSGSWACRDDVSFRIDAHVFQPECLEPPFVLRRTCCLLEGRRRDFADGCLLIERPCVVCAYGSEGRSNLRMISRNREALSVHGRRQRPNTDTKGN